MEIENVNMKKYKKLYNFILTELCSLYIIFKIYSTGFRGTKAGRARQIKQNQRNFVGMLYMMMETCSQVKTNRGYKRGGGGGGGGRGGKGCGFIGIQTSGRNRVRR